MFLNQWVNYIESEVIHRIHKHGWMVFSIDVEDGEGQNGTEFIMVTRKLEGGRLEYFLVAICQSHDCDFPPMETVLFVYNKDQEFNDNSWAKLIDLLMNGGFVAKEGDIDAT